MPDIYIVGIVIVLALCFDFINGFHDTANAIATCVATRALSPKVAIIMSAILNFVGAMISTGVAKTIGGEIVTSPHMVDSVVLSSALASAIIWNLFSSPVFIFPPFPSEQRAVRFDLFHQHICAEHKDEPYY